MAAKYVATRRFTENSPTEWVVTIRPIFGQPIIAVCGSEDEAMRLAQELNLSKVPPHEINLTERPAPGSPPEFWAESKNS